MKRKLTIHDFGPIDTCEVTLSKINIVIGPQSSGKSCLLKIASYCSWVEKRVQISQDFSQFDRNDYFINELVKFHKLDGYLHPNSYIAYESDYMAFSYKASDNTFTFTWKDNRWLYTTPKISYIPSERNMVAAIPNLMDISLPRNNILNFISDWERARKSCTRGLDILNLGVTYRYDEANHSDKVILKDTKPIDFTNTSSGLQSLIPASVQIDYLMRTRFDRPSDISVNRSREYDRLLSSIIKYVMLPPSKSDKVDIMKGSNFKVVNIGGTNLVVDSNFDVKLCRDIYSRFTDLSITDLFFEEPEQNLFPPTQRVFADQLIEYFQGEHAGTLFIATHSPYMVNIFLGNPDIAEEMSLFVIKPDSRGSYTATEASAADKQAIYEYDMDVFFNLSSLGQ